MKTIYLINREEWRNWLQKNHTSEDEIWLIYCKKHTGKPRIPYDDAVEEAICFGWIDSLIRRIDDEKFMQKYTPRRKNSVWSLLNKNRALKMIDMGKMTDAGLVKIEEAKNNGKWQKAYTSKKALEMPPELEEALKENITAFENFYNFANSYRNMYIGWVMAAKRKATRTKRINEVVKRAEKNKKPGML